MWKSKGARQNFCQRCSYFMLREVCGIWHVSIESRWILDSFLSDKTVYYVYDILKIICILSHGQSSTERGFSIHKSSLD